MSSGKNSQQTGVSKTSLNGKEHFGQEDRAMPFLKQIFKISNCTQTDAATK